MSRIFNFNDVYEPVFTTSARWVDIWGGRGRGGSHFATDFFLYQITRKGNYFRGLFMREILGDIRKSLYQDFKDRIDENETTDLEEFYINDNRLEISHYETGNFIGAKGFKKVSGKQVAKMKSIAGYSHVVIEECEEVAEEDFDQLDDSLRTVKGDIMVIRLFNPPPANHWLIRNYYNLEPIDHEIFKNDLLRDKRDNYFRAVPKGVKNHLSIFSTYKDNEENLAESTIEKIEMIRNKVTESDYFLNYYLVTYLGFVPTNDIGLIFPEWKTTEDYPEKDPVLAYWLDFGFTNDPTAFGEVKKVRGQIFVKEYFYETGLTNVINADNPQQPSIELRLKENNINKEAFILADKAAPKDIVELRQAGYNIYGAPKFPGSIKTGINTLKKWIVNIHRESVNIINEKERYKWKEHSQTGELINEPIDAFNHHIDGIRGVFLYYSRSGEL